MRSLIDSLSDSPGFNRTLKALGPIGIGTSLMLASRRADAATAAGDHEGAKTIMKEWAIETSGSEIGAAGAAAIAAIGGAALVAAGAIPAGLAAALVFGAAIAGGFFGGAGAVELYRAMADRDSNGRRDIVDKLSNILFGATSTITSQPLVELGGAQVKIRCEVDRA